jgi:hypothetical protein
MIRDIDELNKYFNQKNLHINKIIQLEPNKWAAQIIHTYTDTSEKWLLSAIQDSEEQVFEILNNIKEYDMTSIFKLCGDIFQYMSAEMLPKDKPVTLTVKSVKQEKVANRDGEQDRAVVHWKETKNGLVLGNKTNIRSLVSLFGADVDDWKDKKVVLHTEKVRAFGKVHNAIRIDEQATFKANVQQPQNQVAQPSLLETEQATNINNYTHEDS